jgi:protein-S-isoprenylcysteine O-methyltransferase Ste14
MYYLWSNAFGVILLIGLEKMIRILIWFILLAGGLIAGPMLDMALFPNLFCSISFHLVSFVFGAILLRLVINGARNTGRQLAHGGRVGDLPRMETNRLVTTGLYRCMRHPMHLALLFFPLALALLEGSPSFIIIIWPMEVLFMLVMIRFVEEPGAKKKFGADYTTYEKEVPMFTLSRSCLQELFLKRSKTPCQKK